MDYGEVMVNGNCYLLASRLVGIMAESTFHWIMHVIHPGCGSVTVLSSILSVLLHDIRLIMLWTQYFCLFLFNWCVGFFMTESIWDCFSDGCDRAFVVILCGKKKDISIKFPLVSLVFSFWQFALPYTDPEKEKGKPPFF